VVSPPAQSSLPPSHAEADALLAAGEAAEDAMVLRVTPPGGIPIDLRVPSGCTNHEVTWETNMKS
jgi:hypothetical protein